MKKTFPISGMHCVSCEIQLEKELKKIQGIKPLQISHKKKFAEIEIEDESKIETIENIIEKCGYHLTKNQPKQKIDKNTVKDYLQIIVIFVLLFFLFRISQKLEINQFFPSFGSQITILIALMLGLVASISTCLALVGGIVIGFGSTYKVEEDKKHPFLARALPHLYFHLGRIGGFAILGGLLGLIGSKINYSLGFTGYFTMLIGLVMFYLGLQILNIVPNITQLGFHLPKFLSNKTHHIESSNHHFAPILIGILTFFLPCGFTQSMQLAAVASQSFLNGAIIMGTFALGTLPVLISIGIGSSYAQNSKFNLSKKVLGIIIIFFAIYSLNSGSVLANLHFSLPKINTTQDTTTIATETDGYQIIKMDVDWTFKPNEFQIKKGIPVRWEIRGVNVSGCSNEIVIPQLNIRQKIEQGQTKIIEFTPTETGVLPFSCWMGMLNGKFIVIN